MRGLVLAVAVVGCGFQVPGQVSREAGVGDGAPGGDGGPIDGSGPIDAAIDAPPDAAVSLCNASGCLGIGGTCQGGECVVNVTLAGALSCPAGMRCRFNCNSGIACKAGIDCMGSAGCTIDCAVMNACQGSLVNCVGAGCTLYCRQMNTCINMTFRCGSGATSCAAECCPGSSCGGNLQVLAGDLDTHSPGTCP